MKKREQRIASFIDSIKCEEINSDSQGVLLNADMDSIGGDNSKDCKNYQASACAYVNNGGACKNFGVCDSSDNKGSCENRPPVPVVDPGPLPTT